MQQPNGTVRVAAISDVHYGKSSHGALQPLFAEIAQRADVMVICGDLTDYGLPEEARILARDITAALKIPVVAVLGNHDFESGREDEVQAIMSDAGVHMLDGDSVELHGIGFAGVKGFCGGFGRGALGAWGESTIKQFVRETLDEALKLESALARLKTSSRLAVLHYAPIRETVEGEPLEIYPFLGSSRLEEPLARYGVTAVLHGHAHKGAPQGTMAAGIPVYNVAIQVLRDAYPDRTPYRLLEVPSREAPAPEDTMPVERRRG